LIFPVAAEPTLSVCLFRHTHPEVAQERRYFGQVRVLVSHVYDPRGFDLGITINALRVLPFE
jgi:hypothetical protein